MGLEATIRTQRPAALLALLLAAVGCSPAEVDNVPCVTVEPAVFEVKIHGRGELKAAKATPIEIPTTLQGIQRIAWLADEGREVAEGDVIAKLDEEQTVRRIREIKDALSKLNYQLDSKRSQLNKEKQDLKGQLELLASKKENAEFFLPQDESLFSRHDILDAKIDLELISSKVEHFEARQKRYVQRAAAELEILQLQRKTEQVKLNQLESALANLEIRAPHTGLFLRGKTWQGEKMRVGMSVWPGMSLGEFPDVSEMEAKIHVLESEAAGLGEGLDTSVILEAHAGRSFTGKIKSIEPVANPIDRGSPVKYFEVLLSLDETDVSIMKPAGEVRATIFVAQEDAVLSVPNQAIFHKGDETWVWVADKGGFRKAPVSLGQRSLSRTVVTEGIDSGFRIALVDPAGQGEG